MADTKISALPSATTPLAGSEVVPIVQSGATKKVAVDDLTVKNLRSNATTGILQMAGVTAGNTRTMTVPDANFTVARTDAANSFTGDQTLSTGNLVVSNGKGIDFSATPGTGTSELFNDYEEGTYTVVFKDNTLSNYSLTSSVGKYTKIGRRVFITGNVVFAGGPPGGGYVVPANLPYTPSSTTTIWGQWSYGPAGDTLCRGGPSGNWANGGSYAYAIQYGNNSASLFNGVAATDYMAFTLEYDV